MLRWEKLSLELRYYFQNKIVHVDTNKPIQNVLEEISFILEKGVF